MYSTGYLVSCEHSGGAVGRLADDDRRGGKHVQKGLKILVCGNHAVRVVAAVGLILWEAGVQRRLERFGE